jgi:hypothetical protein
MGKMLGIIWPLLMLTSVKFVDSLLDEEAADEVRCPKRALHVPYHHMAAELMESKKSKKSFASFRIRPKGKLISNYFELSLCLGTKDRMMIKAAYGLMHRLKQMIRSQALEKEEDEDNNEEKKVKRRRTNY